MIIVSNTTPIITLIKANKLEILKHLFNEVYISTGVYDEIVANKVFKNEVAVLEDCDFINIKKVKNEFAVKLLQKNMGLDLGESEAIVLCDELNGDILIIDERKGRAVAKSMDINLTGTLGLLVKAKERGLIDQVKPILDLLIESNIRISTKLYEDILEKVNEN